MSDHADEILTRLRRLETAIAEQTRAFDRLSGNLEVRCPNNEQRIKDLEQQQQIGGRRNGWIDPKFWTTAIIALGALATAIAAIMGARP